MSLRLVVVALILTTVLALGAMAWRLSPPAHPAAVGAPAAPPPPLMLNYLTAAHALPAGTLAREEDYAVRTAVSSDVPAAAIIDTPASRAALRGALIRRYLDSGAAITAGDILRPRDRGFLATVLAPGTRAVSVPVDAVTGVAGLIWPGDLVDVLLTQQVEGEHTAPDKRVLSRTILNGIRVIAVDQQIVQGATGDVQSAGHVARTVTLEVTPGQAERLAVGQHLGVLSLAIRPLQVEAERGLNAPVFGGDLSPELRQAPHVEVPPSLGMQIIEGDQRSVVKFQ